MVPVFWLALYGTARQLGLTIAGIAILFIAPVLLLESDRYPATEWERAILWTATAAIVGYTVQGLVRRIQRQAAALDELARTDEVTGLPNRRAWQEALTREAGVAAQQDHPLSIAVLELDDFETFSERHGRQEAEKLIKVSGLAWRGRLPANVLLARSGPHDFRIVLARTSKETTVGVVDGLRDGTPAMQTFCAGIAQWNGRESPEALVARADSALDEARRGGSGATVTAYEAVRDERDEALRRLLER
ncbi:MAG: GGDEF domain-containing protein [Actinobacteria bacterium]|nr:GGDEF domain-containing protein [Actinomycetota bacterium]